MPVVRLNGVQQLSTPYPGIPVARGLWLHVFETSILNDFGPQLIVLVAWGLCPVPCGLRGKSQSASPVAQGDVQSGCGGRAGAVQREGHRICRACTCRGL